MPATATLQGSDGATAPGAPVSSVRIVGAPVSIVSPQKVLSIFEQWVQDRRDRVVLLREVHGLMRARTEQAVGEAQEQADLVLPDGMPLVWLARLAGFRAISRVCGIDLLPAVCRFGVPRGWRHYFYGASPGVAEALAATLRRQMPGLEIVGVHCPPFRALSPEEDEAACAQIRAARPHFVWVSLSTPKQDLWMAQHRGRCGGAIMVGVGAAFEINAGRIARAPRWMQQSGLEWLYRLAQEPGRLWQRYARVIPGFVMLASIELVRRRLAAVRQAGPPVA
jgi:N-acetylglucosaminyldiphosphoundecaprenol N-acetyl-beta-D-mannosaminyltransferase